MSKIVLLANGDAENEYLDYRNNELPQAGSDSFQANLFPLGKESLESWPHSYENLFEFKSKNEYEQYVRNDPRFEMLFKEWSTYRPKITICFGKSEWPTFKSMFGLSNHIGHEYSRGCSIYPSKGIILCPFFGYRPNCMPSHRTRFIAQEARKLLLMEK